MEEKDRTLGLRSVVSISVGLVIATSCLVSLGQGAGSIGVVFIGAMVIACLLNMTTVAEGVETKEYVDFLKELGCDYVQGFYYYKPMSVEDFEELFVKNPIPSA